MTLFFAIKTLLGLLIIPFLLAQYVSKATSLTGSRQARWGFKNVYLYLIVALGAAAVALEVYVYRASSTQHKDVPLEFLSTAKYSADLEMHKLPDPNWDQVKSVLLRRFEHAEYAWQAKDYNEVLNMLGVIKAGKDAYGSFMTIPSYVIANNMGCARFRLQRNKGFAAAFDLKEARALAPSGSPEAEVVERNLQRLDDMVNALD